MTCIAGVLDEDGSVWVGGDSAGVEDGTLDTTIRADTKVWVDENETFVYGFCDSWRVGQVLQHQLEVPGQSRGESVMRYLTGNYMDAVRDTLKNYGVLKTEDGVESAETAFILGYRCRIFLIDADFQVGEPSDPFIAVGCGAAYAIGSLHSTENYTIPPKKRIELALDAAAYYSGAVRAPFKVVCLNPPA